MSKSKISFHVLTFNKLSYLKNLINSFNECNLNKNYEFIIADYGSTDGTREYIKKISKKNEKFIPLFGNRLEYFRTLEDKGLNLKKFQIQKYAMTHKYRSDVLNIVTGQYCFDLGERHQFIRQFKNFDEIISDYQYIENNYKLKVGGFNVRSPSLYSIYKKNNSYSHIVRTKNNTYYVCDKKGYDDFFFWNKQTYDKFGDFKYQYINNKNADSSFSHLHDYSKRLIEKNYRKIFLKYPLTIEFPVNFFGNELIKYNKQNLFFGIIDNDEFKISFKYYKRPITSNDLLIKYGLNCISKTKVLKNIILNQNYFYYMFKNYNKLYNYKNNE